MARSILLVDDDPAILYLHGRHFQGEGWDVYRAMGGEDGIRLYSTHTPDVVLLDLNMPDLSGFEVLAELVKQEAVVILLTGHGEVENAVKAVQLGAENFLTKPVRLSHLDAIVQKAAEKAELRRTNRLLADQIVDGEGRDHGLGSSPKMQEITRHVELVARSDQATVMLQGESGTGKGWVASHIHRLSPRARKPFVEINCAGLSATFLDSELFGHEKGAFTDAKTMKRGLLEVAQGGTVFLDEIGDLSPELQPKLLKVLEGRSFRRLGGTAEIRSDVRLIAASNKKLELEAAAGRFREDLYYRLNVLAVYLPPLRERSTADILDLVNAILDELAERGPGGRPSLTDNALATLLHFDWPGNVRQLRNALEHALVMAGGSQLLDAHHLPHELQPGVGTEHRSGLRFAGLTLREMERRHIEHTLMAHAGHRTKAAEALGISRATLHSKIKEFGLNPPAPRPAGGGARKA